MRRTLQSADAQEVAAYVREHGLKSTGLGEWSGTVEGDQVTVRLVSRREAAAQNVTVIVNNVFKGKRKKKGGSDKSVGQAFVDFARDSRWF